MKDTELVFFYAFRELKHHKCAKLKLDPKWQTVKTGRVPTLT